jgi:phosphatidylglycerophosphate synthase
LLLTNVGYTRVILAGLSLHFMSFHPKYCTLAYVISCLLDAVDGQAARALGQTSKFGAVLDMVTDRCVFGRRTRCGVATDFHRRCTTSCLLCYLSSVYPDYAILFQFLIALDFSSHYMHMYRLVHALLHLSHSAEGLYVFQVHWSPDQRATNWLQVMLVEYYGCITMIL